MHNKLPTAERLFRFGMVNSQCCALCSSHQETSSHLFFDCEVARALWELIEGSFIGIKSVLSFIGLYGGSTLGGGNFGSPALALCLNAVYSLWIARNNVVFENVSPHIESLFANTLALTVHYVENSNHTKYESKNSNNSTQVDVG
ncbi:hypothetical protein Cni_G26549 [Canna indica]|uniref:Reverse transcriptase zinc-binding domain-containing protein n=1 Tax=Canna indica TaxID=4628 RepID=A0AAQ3L401_9LILI|nr:hypothetical protein Cni_G26549 [Canna indica]